MATPPTDAAAPRRTRGLWRDGRAVGALLAALAIALSCVPWLLGTLTAARSGWAYAGTPIGVEDTHSYIAKMRSGARGDWGFVLRYTHEPQVPVVGVYLHYHIAGWLAGVVAGPQPTHATLAGAFHVFRLVGAALLLMVLWRFYGAVLQAPSNRPIAYALALFGGGLGWLLLAQQHVPPEFLLPEGFTPLALATLPHLLLARALLLGGFLALFAAHERASSGGGGWATAMLSGACWAAMTVIVPFYVAVAATVGVAWVLLLALRRRRVPWALVARGALAGVVAAPVVAYFAVAFVRVPTLAAWGAQNILPSPPPWHYALSYGPLALAAALGARWAWRRAATDVRAALLLAWVLVVPFLVYAPLNVQRRLAEGVIVPLAALGAVGLGRVVAWLGRWFTRDRARALVLAAALLLLPTQALLLLGMAVGVASPARPAFTPPGLARTLTLLAGQVTPDDVVLARFEEGNLVPAYTDARTFVGHGPETLDASAKRAQAAAFFDGTLPPDAAATLLDAATWVLAPPQAVLPPGLVVVPGGADGWVLARVPR